MEYINSIDLLLWLAGGALLALIALIVLEFYNASRVRKLAYPAYEFALKRADEEASRVLEQARESARQLLAKAESDSIALASSRASEEDASVQTFKKDVHVLLDTLQKQFEEDVRSAREARTQAATAVAAQIQAYGEETKQQMDTTRENLEKELAKRIDEQVAGAFATAQAAAEKYMHARKDAIDAHIMEIVTGAMKIILKKDLPDTVQADLVRSALEEAKASHAF